MKPRHNEVWIVQTPENIQAIARYDKDKGWWRFGADYWYPHEAFIPTRRYQANEGASA